MTSTPQTQATVLETSGSAFSSFTLPALTPRQIVAELDKHIVGQYAAKRAVAIAIRNRWRRQQLPPELRKDVMPKNIILVGPTGVGKTEIARRLAQLVGAPFVKIEATRFTEVGYVGRDVESIIRDLAKAGAALVRQQMYDQVREQVQARVREKLLDLLLPGSGNEHNEEGNAGTSKRRMTRSRQRLAAQLDAGALEDRIVTVEVSKKADVPFFAAVGVEQVDTDFHNIINQVIPHRTTTRDLPIREARKLLLEQVTESLIDRTTLAEHTVELVENHGIVFLDEIDKICGPQSTHGPDISRQGVQRDLLPIVEGATVHTNYGPVRTDHILFIAAGAFHTSKPSDLMPELQGRFPIRVELNDLNRDDFVRILTEPQHALTRQYIELLRTEGIELEFTPDGVEALADIAYQVNLTHQNIGARRLHTVLEKVVEDISFEAPDCPQKHIVIDANFVRQRLQDILQREDLSQFIL